MNTNEALCSKIFGDAFNQEPETPKPLNTSPDKTYSPPDPFQTFLSKFEPPSEEFQNPSDVDSSETMVPRKKKSNAGRPIEYADSITHKKRHQRSKELKESPEQRDILTLLQRNIGNPLSELPKQSAVRSVLMNKICKGMKFKEVMEFFDERVSKNYPNHVFRA